jgi:hypothetical protein
MQSEHMKTPEIKGWDCIDHDPIENWSPEDPSNVEFWCNLSIGLKGEAGADNFQVHIATNDAVSRIESKEYLVVIPRYDNWTQVLGVLDSIVSQCKDVTWLRISEKLSKHFYWEYEEMR